MESAPSEPSAPRPWLGWRRRRVWALALLGLAVLAALGVALWKVSHTDPRALIRWLGEQAGYRVEVARVERPKGGRLVVRGLQVEDFARLEYLELHWTLVGLLRREVDALWVRGLEIRLGRMQAALDARARTAAASEKPARTFPFVLKKLVIAYSQLVLDNLGAGIPPLPVRLGEETPLVFENLKLGGDSTDPAASEVQLAEVENLTLYSPYDPLAPVLSFRRIRIGFSWAGIERKQLDLLLLEEPVIYVGPDLFWFTDRLKDAAAQAPASPGGEAGTPWTVTNFEIRAGGLVLTRDGEKSIRLPLLFETKETGLVLSDFSELRLNRAGFIIPLTNLTYPEYQVKIEGMQGELFFSLPVEERGTKDLSNLTPVLKIARASWKGLEVTDLSVTATFDRKGIYGAVYGRCYAGQINGGFTVLLDQAMTWNAWASTTGVDLGPVTNLLSPEHFIMRGTVDSVFDVRARSKTIDTFTGRIALNRPGTMEITAIDRLLADLPEEWTPLKRELSRVSLEAFRFYEYSGGTGRLNYAPPVSSFALSLDGVQGKRNFNLTWTNLGLLARNTSPPVTPSHTRPPARTP